VGEQNSKNSKAFGRQRAQHSYHQTLENAPELLEAQEPAADDDEHEQDGNSHITLDIPNSLSEPVRAVKVETYNKAIVPN
jgi:hypothetical protein